MMGITGAFSSLGINERSRTSQDSLKIPKNHSTLSLPNLVSSDRASLFRNNYSSRVCDDEIDSSEQPVDFSKKYCETKQIKPNFSKVQVVKSYHNSFTMYAETDLDQPTDYSLRYAEDDSDSEQCNKITKTETGEFQDTIKTYCTEDTPYETPFNFSTSTSISDLRIDDKAPLKKDVTVITKEIPQAKIKSEFSSGLMSPEKPVNYCEEGTPGYFSRVPSCGSLNSIPKQETVKKEQRRAETKAVKFEEVVNYAEETPLMFSRSSSLASLDSIEQHSIHDDRSSVVSDFSRLTSGLISPSELPDSPSQTVPPSPKPRKNPIVFPPVPPKKTKPKEEPKSSVFEDVVKKFEMERTPSHFSTATSLSSLIDEEIDQKAPDVGNTDKEADLSESSEDEGLLAACINIGMQNNRYSQPKTPPEDIPQTYRYTPCPEIVSKKTDLQKSDITSDSVKTYCTEDTPAILSHAGSNSDLSNLSLHGIDKTLIPEMNEVPEIEAGPCTQDDREVPEKNDVATNGSHSSRRSSFSSLSDDSDESEQALLQECILAGMPTKPASKPSDIPDNLPNPDITGNPIIIQNESSDDEDENILTECINIGITNNRYTKPKLNHTIPPQAPIKNTEIVNDSIKSYCTEDTPAILSHAGSCSNLSILSIDKPPNLNYTLENNASDTESLSSLSDTSYESEQALLQQCIQAGMPKRPQSPNDLTPDEKALLQQCILEGMKKCQNVPKKRYEDDSSELTEAEQALLRQCILSGMPKNKNLTQGGPSASRESTELSEAERVLLQQCILAGMPKSRRERQWKKREESREHTCCVHCPKNKGVKQGNIKRKKYKVRESRDVNILYVTSQILTMKKEVVERGHEEWV